MFPSRLCSGPQRGLWQRWIRIKQVKAGTASTADISTLMATVWKGRGYVRRKEGTVADQEVEQRSNGSRVIRSVDEYSLFIIIDLIKVCLLTSTTRPQSHKTRAHTHKVISLIKEWWLVSMVTQANISDMFLSEAASWLFRRQKVEGPESPRDQTRDECYDPAQLGKVNKWRSHRRMRAMVVSATSTDSSSGSSWIPFGNRRFSITTDSSLVSMLYSNTLAENRTARGF